MPGDTHILYCHCAFARVVPPATKSAVLEQLSASDRPFEAVADLCEMSARRDPRLKELASGGGLTIVACYPRAVKGLFHAAGSPLADGTNQILNMRVDPPETIVRSILSAGGGS